jgi:uncharacterized protein (TIGR02594 family)
MLPKQYAWLANEPGPKMIVEALSVYGLKEVDGPGNNATLMRWARALGPGVTKIFTADAVPWCGLAVGYWAMKAGKPRPASPLWARAWASWGSKSPKPSLGDVLVFNRPGGAHVGLYVGEDKEAYHVLGGNQSNGVNIKRLAKARLVAARRLYNKIPANVRPVHLSPTGAVSTNEA